MHNYPYKIYNPVSYEGADLIVYNAYCGKAHIDKKGDEWVSTLQSYADIKETIKDHYIKEQDYTCCYCKQRIVVKHKGSWDAEHVIPRHAHPAFIFEPENIAISCKDCNKEKSGKEVLVNTKTKHRKKFLKDKSDYVIIHPHFDEYDLHIEIRNSIVYRGRTDKGVATITICGLLRFGKDTNYTDVSPQDLSEVTEAQSRLVNAKTVDEQYAVLEELDYLIQEKKKELYKLRSMRKKNQSSNS